MYPGSTATIGSGGGGNYLQVNFPATATTWPDPEWFALAAVTPANFYTGDWTGGGEGTWITFDFYAPSTIPYALQLQMQGGDDDNVWWYSIDPGNISVGWNTFAVNLVGTGWDTYTGSDFLGDLGAIDWIGVFIDRYWDQPETYGIDNFQLWVPEPAEWAMLAAALLTLAWSLRKRGLDIDLARWARVA